jgi:transcription-repair coupling factor (superfamily II helicase)
MLAEAIENIKLHNDISIDSTPWSPTINIGISVQIPETYISDSSLRLSIYRKIAQISELNELESFAAELIDRFGTLPTDAEHLFEVIKLKQLAKNLNIAKIDCGEKAVLISFRNNKPINPDKILSFIKTNSAKLKQDGKLLINREFKDEAGKIRGIEKILAHLQ